MNVRGGLKKIRCLAARQKTEVCIEVDISENGKKEPKWRYSLEMVNTGGGIQTLAALVNREEVYNYESKDMVLLRDSSYQGDDSETKNILIWSNRRSMQSLGRSRRSFKQQNT